MDKQQALSRAMALCSQKESTEAGIRGKLKSWGADPSDFDDIIEELVREKFVDDLRYAIAYAADKIRLNQWGKVKVRYMLSMERVSHSLIDQALDKIDPQFYIEILQELLNKKARELKGESNPYNKKQKLVKFAQGRGFEVELILRVLKDIS